MAAAACTLLGRSLFTPFAECPQSLRKGVNRFCSWKPILLKPKLALKRASPSRVVAYQLPHSEARIRRPSAQVSSRLYAAAASGAPGVRSVPVQVANELVEAGHKYVDVRTPEEFENGHPEGAINVPYMLKHGGGMTKNQDFIREMKDQFDPDAELVVGCLSGKRSMLAAAELVREEFTNVTDVGGGYQAWEMSGLPVERSARVA